MTYDPEAAKEWPHDKSHVGPSPFPPKLTDAETVAVLRRLLNAHLILFPDERPAIERAIELLERESTIIIWANGIPLVGPTDG